MSFWYEGEGSFEVRIPRPTKMGLHVDLRVIFPKTETNIIFKLFVHIIAQFDTKCPWQEKFSPMLTGKRSNLKVTDRRPQGDTTYYILLTRILFKLVMQVGTSVSARISLRRYAHRWHSICKTYEPSIWQPEIPLIEHSRIQRRVSLTCNIKSSIFWFDSVSLPVCFFSLPLSMFSMLFNHTQHLSQISLKNQVVMLLVLF